MKSFALSLLLSSTSAYNFDYEDAIDVTCSTDDDCDYVCGLWVTVGVDPMVSYRGCVSDPRDCDSRWDGGYMGVYDVYCEDSDYLDWKYDVLVDTQIELITATQSSTYTSDTVGGHYASLPLENPITDETLQLTTDWLETTPNSCAKTMSDDTKPYAWWQADFKDRDFYQVHEVWLLSRNTEGMRPPSNSDPEYAVEDEASLGANNAEAELAEAMILVGNKQCGRVPSDPPQGRWFKVTCYGDGVTGNIINIVKTTKSSLAICGIKVVGVKDAVHELYNLQVAHDEELYTLQ